MKNASLAFILGIFLIQGCETKKGSGAPEASESGTGKLRVLFDSDTNNELDDQHALAYLLFSGDRFDLAGVTVNSTINGGRIEGQFAEAVRVMKLCGLENVPVYKGANSSFDTIRSSLTSGNSFDGSDAVRFIVGEAKKTVGGKLVIIAVGKLTNIALALQLEPTIADKIKLVWLGSNYPESGEYNLENDTASVNYVLESSIEFEIVTVRYGKSTGSDVVRITKEDVGKNLRGRGPIIQNPVAGRHGGQFTSFGDYSVSLFENAHYSGTPPSRALFDMVAVAVVKNPSWGQLKIIPAPRLINNQWIERPSNPRKIGVWENFDKQKILDDFYNTMEHYRPVKVAE